MFQGCWFGAQFFDFLFGCIEFVIFFNVNIETENVFPYEKEYGDITEKRNFSITFVRELNLRNTHTFARE